MRTPLSPSDLEALELAAAPERLGHLAVAELLQQWATDHVPGDSVSRGRLLVAASEHATFAGDAARAVQLAEAALDTGDHVAPDTRCYLVSALLGNGQLCEALELTEDVLDDRGDDAEALVYLGEEFSWHGQSRTAHQLLTRGLFRCATDDEAAEALLTALRRVRSGRVTSVDVRGGVPAQAGRRD